MINIKLQYEERDQKVFQPREIEVRKQPVDKKIGTQLKANDESRNNMTTEKKEISTKGVKDLFAKVPPKKDSTTNKENGTTTIKKESPPTPKKDSPKAKESPKKKDVKKDPAKNSIATFFNNKTNTKPTSTVTQNSPPVVTKDEPKTPSKLEETVKIEKPTSKSATKSRKETASDSVKRTLADLCDDGSTSEDDRKIIPSTPQEKIKKPSTKRPRKNDSKKQSQNGNARKRSRIVELEDSSDDESLTDTSTKSPLKLTKAGVENGSSPIAKTNGSPSKRHIAKRVVTRTYEDKDGFIRKRISLTFFKILQF